MFQALFPNLIVSVCLFPLLCLNVLNRAVTQCIIDKQVKWSRYFPKM